MISEIWGKSPILRTALQLLEEWAKVQDVESINYFPSGFNLRSAGHLRRSQVCNTLK